MAMDRDITIPPRYLLRLRPFNQIQDIRVSTGDPESLILNMPSRRIGADLIELSSVVQFIFCPIDVLKPLARNTIRPDELRNWPIY